MYHYFNAYTHYYNDTALIPFLTEYIMDEIQDARYYEALAEKAPTERAKKIILEFAQQELHHAEEFKKAYYIITGQTYETPLTLKPLIPDYEEALKVRLLAETQAYKEYGEKYLMAQNPMIKDIFFRARTDEAVHAMRIPLLMEEELEND